MSNKQVDHLFDAAAKKFDRSLEDLDQDVKRLEEWLKTQPHLPKILDQNFFRNFLILNKGSVEIAKQKIDNYFTMRSVLPEIFYEMNPKLPYHKAFNEMIYLTVHPVLTDEMYKLYFIKVKGDSVPESFDPLDAVRRLTILYELRFRQEVMCGDFLVIDLEGFTFNAAVKFTPMLLYKYLTLLYEKIVSSRLKAVHLINVAPILIQVVNIFKRILKPKLAARIYTHSNADILKEFIQLDLLPVDFGGQGLSLKELENDLERKFALNQELFDSLDQIQVDENLRPAKLKNDEVSGYYGSFKKLNID